MEVSNHKDAESKKANQMRISCQFNQLIQETVNNQNYIDSHEND